MISHATSTTAAATQPRPERPMLRGSGGGAPDGRRRRPVRRAAGATVAVASVTGTPVTPPGRGSTGTVTGAPSLRCERAASASERAASNGLRGRGTP